MRTNNIFSIIVLLLLVIQSQGQNIYGILQNQNAEPLFGATVQWQGTTLGTVVDENGNFELPKKDTAANLLIRYVGYDPIFINVEPSEDTVFIQIDGVSELLEIEIAAKIRDNYLSRLNPINIESISSKELKKAACCSLAESFETNGSVDISYSDAVTGAKEIQMLGLRGLYVQMLIEKRPALTGLGSSLAMEFLPGTWLESIQISKGAGSVQNGYQSIVGQINSTLKKPFEDKPLFVNLFATPMGRFEANVHLNKKINDEWSSGLLLHGNYMQHQVDNNGDSFMDMPTKKQLNGMYRLFYRGDIIRSQFNIHALTDERVGGQTTGGHAHHGGGHIGDLYTVFQRNRRVEVFGKIGYLGFEKENTSLGFIYNASWHRLNNSYGYTDHLGTQKNAYANLIYNTYLGNTDHSLNAGLSYIYDDYEEKLNDSDFDRKERVPGIFAEYSLARNDSNFETFNDKFGLIIGLRYDHHNQFGSLFSPKANVKFNFSDKSIVRLAAGRGFRTPNVIAENISVLASSRLIEVLEDLEMEEAWNFGINFTQNFPIGARELTFAADLYRTQFENQVIVDLETKRNSVLFYNLDGKSFSNSFLTMVMYELVENLNLKLAYKFNDVKMKYKFEQIRPENAELVEKPLLAKHRGLITLDYETRDENWMFSTHLQLVGKQRFPDNSALPADLRKDHEGYAPSYAVLGAQITRYIGNLEIYLGGENLNNYRQENPIIGWEDPFGDYFDATQVYAPVVGIRGYLGVRWFLE